jgi:hypothetical protein
MSFKHKKKIHEILKMDFDEYAKFLKKETLRAAKFGELDAVICSNHKFDNGKESSLILMGAFVGDLAAYFKRNKAKPGFAKGKCFFETTEDGIKMHIAISTGKGKPDKITKVGRKLWKKAGLEPLFHDKLPFLDEALGKVNLGETELAKINLGETELKKSADIENNNQAIKLVKNNYLKSRKVLQDRVLPLISNKETLDSAYTNQHFKIAKVCLKNAASFLNKFKEINTNKQELYQEEITNLLTDEYPKLRRIAAKVKQALMATNAVDINLNKSESLSKEETDHIYESSTKLDKEF